MSRLLTPQEAEQFKEMLAGYELREEGLKQFRESNFGIIAGPAGAGKDTLRNGLVDRYPDQYVPILSTTTRPPREGEADGITYHFREVDTVRRGLEQREYFQAELVHGQQVSCLELDEIRKLSASQWGLSILITEAERKIQPIKPDTRTVFLIPPTFEVLLERMNAERRLEQDEINRRLAAARKEVAYALESQHYFCLVSESVDPMIEQAHEYFQTNIMPDGENANARTVMRDIIARIEEA